MRIGGRLVLLLAVPLVGLLAVTGFGVVSGVQQAREATGLEQRTALALTTYALIDDLQIERSALVDRTETPADTRAAVATNADTVRSQSAEIGGAIQQAADRALVRVDAAERVDALGLGGRAAMASHSSAIDFLLVLATIAIDPGASIDGAPAETANNLARAQAASAEERDLVVVVSQEQDLSAQTFQELTSLASAQTSYADLAQATAIPALAVQIERVGHGIDAADSIRRDVYIAPGERNFSSWISGLEVRTADLTRLQGDASILAVQAVDDLATSSRTLLVLAALAAIATLLITALLLRRAIRSIARPLEELATQAEDVARVRLPAAVKSQQLEPGESLHLPPLRATGAAEVFEVASAFNDVQDTALRLASEQAALRVNQSEALTNLGRRNQTLLARQLDFISSLETKETDPVFLEHLFKLDHLASRMRRNAESLLILAGSETPRRRRAPAQVSEVVRAAMSEVEEFERVRIGHLRDATLTGPVVIDLIHLLAELIENALGFSPPDTTVEIDGRSLGQGGYQFAVIDHGVGMSDVELVAANQRLGGLDELEGMPTRYLGQYVVAKLAAKTGVMVRLQPSSGGRGVTALVTLPGTSVVGAPDRSTITSPMPGSKASREQGPAPFAPGAGVSASARPTVPSPSTAPTEVPAVIDATVVPDLRDRPDDSEMFAVPVAERSDADAAPDLDTILGLAGDGSDERSFFDLPIEDLLDPVGDRYDSSTFDMRQFDTPGVEQVEERPVEGAPADEAPVYDRTTFDHTPVEAPAVESEPAGDTDHADDPEPDKWDRFSREVFDEVPVEVAPAEIERDPDAVFGFVDPAHEPDAVEPAMVEPEVAGPDVVEPHVDPVAAFAQSPFADTAFARAAFAKNPPPTPGEIPVQPDWSPFTDESAAVAPALAVPTASVPTADVPTADAPLTGASQGPAASNPFEPAVVEARPTPAPTATSPFTASGPGGLTGAEPPGGLARRVPGASLAESRQPSPSDAPTQPTDRSADGVRSMLSSFQAGRSRGQMGPENSSMPTGSETDTSDKSQDGRSTR